MYNNYIYINQLLNQNSAFVAYRNPHQHKVVFHTEGTFSLREVNIRQIESHWDGYLFMPFDSDENGYFFDFSLSETNLRNTRLPQNPVSQVNQVGYIKLIDELKLQMHLEGVDKVVFSRNQKVASLSNKQKSLLFDALCAKYPGAYVYIINLPNQTVWMGATPETLLHVKDGIGKTMALAGTQQLINRPLDEISWQEKEIEEQQFVTDYIYKVLHETGAQNIKIGEPYTKQAAALVHICTEISFTVPQKLGQILHLLHPTPAVCGVPKQKAFQLIKQMEGYNRDFYTGFLGRVSPLEISLFVNLRCLQSLTDYTYIYMGGGVTQKSDSSSEWAETERKSETLLSVIKELANV